MTDAPGPVGLVTADLKFAAFGRQRLAEYSTPSTRGGWRARDPASTDSQLLAPQSFDVVVLRDLSVLSNLCVCQQSVFPLIHVFHAPPVGALWTSSTRVSPCLERLDACCRV
ncbi:hypothetical protein Y032_0003g1490 [Ancylostoma ceylanicum]|uniref:Uncharacterized protein n=1 Tax=Ancylostoma ceylanicum TaxID=53326 RepID=A0A016VXE0_9BILA|nr:hypothetical protein Y032_0003g1490 [Ancylostoma ceylanicum]